MILWTGEGIARAVSSTRRKFEDRRAKHLYGLAETYCTYWRNISKTTLIGYMSLPKSTVVTREYGFLGLGPRTYMF